MAKSSKAEVTAAEASSPPPLPDEPLPEQQQEDTPVDQPITSIGEDEENHEDEYEDEGDEDEDEDEEEDDDEDESSAEPSAKRLKGKGKATDDNGQAAAPADGDQPWQAVWSAEQNAWYFWNTKTGEVTWTNPMDPNAASSSHPAAPEQPPLPEGLPPETASASNPVFGLPPEIDPELAHLLPPSQRGSQTTQTGAQTALFNSRTGRFTPADYSYTVDHLDEYNRSKRMNNHYFDVEAWERQKAEDNAKRKRDEAMGVGANKKITKKDMERFKKKAQEKKYRSQAWLRE